MASVDQVVKIDLWATEMNTIEKLDQNKKYDVYTMGLSRFNLDCKISKNKWFEKHQNSVV